MSPQSKKRKLQQPSASGPKRPKQQHPTPGKKKKTATSQRLKGRTVADAGSLAWDTVDIDQFGGLQVIEGVDVVKDGGKVQFVVKDEKKPTTSKTPQQETDTAEDDKDDDSESAQDGQDEPFEGFGDDTVEGKHVPAGKDRPGQDGLEDQVPQEPAAGQNNDGDKKKKNNKDKQTGKGQQSKQTKDDHALGHGRTAKEAPGVNSFATLADADDEEKEEEEGRGGSVDMAAWAALNLSSAMLTAVSKLRFPRPTEIQAQAIPQILDGEDVIGKASTGSGKTLAFGIPMVERWLERHESQQDQQNEQDEVEENDEDEQDTEGQDKKKERRRPPLALVLSPTRELAKQLGDHFKALCNGLLSAPYICVITGGLSIQKQRRQLEKADIIIGTPGRLWEVLEADAKLQDSFAKIEFLVVDEADRLFKAGQFKEAEDIIGALDKRDPEAESDEDDSEGDEQDEDSASRQTLVFSATFDKDLQIKLAGRGKRKFKGDTEENKMEYLMKCLKFRHEPKFIDVNPTRQMAENLKEGLIECGAMEKDLYLYTALLLNPKQRTLIFANSISAVRRITPFLNNLNIDATPLHSQMIQKARLRSLERFTAGGATKKNPAGSKASVLVATDVAARGLDIPQVDMVVHYHVPRAADTYVHRSGRTARGGRTGISVLLCSAEEILPTRRLAAKVHAKRNTSSASSKKKDHVIQALSIDRHIVTRLKPRVDLAKRIADSALAKEKLHSEDSFMRNTAEELGVEYDSEDDGGGLGWKGGRGGGRKRKEKQASELTKAELGVMKAKLREELSKRVNLGVSERYITGGRVDVAALLREREQGGGTAGLFLGGEGLGLSLGFD